MKTKISFPNMLLVGADARNAGKTTFCAGFIRKWKPHYDITAVKVTTIHSEDGHCRRKDGGCGVCGSVTGDFEITEITGQPDNKDTGTLLNAGAKPVYWLRVKKRALSIAALELERLLSRDAIIVCESNSLSEVIQPGTCVLMHSTVGDGGKPSSVSLAQCADLIVDVTDSVAVNAAGDMLTVKRTDGGLYVLASGKL